MEKINNARRFRAARVCRRLGGVIIAIVTSGSLYAPASWAATACAVSTQNMATACHAEKQDEFSVALTICANIANAAAAKACRDDANATLSDELNLCDAQKTART